MCTMVLGIQLYSIFFVFTTVCGGDIIFKVDTKQIVGTSLKKDLTKLAQVFAERAAETFIRYIKYKEHLLDNTRRAKLLAKKRERHLPIPATTHKSAPNKYVMLNDDEAYRLLEKPPPDGDHLGWHSQENTLEEEDREETKRVPVYGLVKVNGIYVRRLFGVRVV